MSAVFASVDTPEPCTFCQTTVEERTYCSWCEATVCGLTACGYSHWDTCLDARHATGSTEDGPVAFRVVRP